MEEEKKSEWRAETVEQSLSKIASSQYKAQLGTNSIRDELKNIADYLERIAEALEKKK